MAKDPEIGAVVELLRSMQPKPDAPPISLEVRRQGFDAFGLSIPLPDGCRVAEITVAGRRADRIDPQGCDTSRALLYLHGGAYILGSHHSHRHLASRIAEAAGIACISLDYRLAPEHPYPAAVEDAVAAYRWMLDQGWAAEHIAISGDSAGGGLTLATVQALKAEGLPMPGCIFPISPWSDLTLSGASYETVAERDPMISRVGGADSAPQYAGAADRREPGVSPVFGDFAGFPPMLIHVGADEVLLSDSLMVAEKAALAGVEVRLEVWPEMIHVWHAFHQYLSAARRATSEAGQWIRAHL